MFRLPWMAVDAVLASEVRDILFVLLIRLICLNTNLLMFFYDKLFHVHSTFPIYTYILWSRFLCLFYQCLATYSFLFLCFLLGDSLIHVFVQRREISSKVLWQGLDIPSPSEKVPPLLKTLETLPSQEAQGSQGRL